jgi:nitrilase
MTKIAIAQESSVFLDRAATVSKAVDLVDAAAAAGAGLVVFPEAYVAGYPAWIWRLRPGGDWDLSEQLHARLLESAVDLERGDLQPLCDAAARRGVTIVCGMNEREASLGRATLYNTAVIIGPDGRLLNRHRKLMPTNPERMVWGLGDASGLRVVHSPCGRLGALICWENYMPLARYALYAQGLELYIAPTYDSGEAWIGTLRHIAREGRAWVLGSGVALAHEDIPEDFPDRARLYPDSEVWINPGDSVVIAPGGEIVAGPLHNDKGVLYAEVDIGQVALGRRTLDVAGHYARPDIFRLEIDTRPQQPAVFTTVPE